MYPSLLLFAEAPTSAILLGLNAASPQSLLSLGIGDAVEDPVWGTGNRFIQLVPGVVDSRSVIQPPPCHPERVSQSPERSEGEGSAQVLLRPDRPSRCIGLYVGGNRRGIQF